jgi:hypothetical protein
VYVPVVATVIAESVTVMVPLPGAATDAAERAAETVLGRPLVEKLMGLLNAPLCADVSVRVAVFPWATLTLVTEGVTVNVVGAVMVSGMFRVVE